MHLWLRLGIARSNKYVGLALALPNALQFYYYTLCESRHFLWNYAEIIAISDKTGRKRRAIEVECSRHYAIHPYCRAAFHTEYVVFHGFYQDIYILYNVYPAVFDKNQLSYKKNKGKAFLLWEKFVLLHSLNGKTPREAHSERVLWQISITYFKEKYKIQHVSLFFGARQAKRHRQYWRLSTKIFSNKGNNSTLDFGQVIRARQIIQNTNKKNIYNEEFDPGSGWTLATGLTHASRGASGGKLASLAGDRRTGE